MKCIILTIFLYKSGNYKPDFNRKISVKIDYDQKQKIIEEESNERLDGNYWK